MNWTDSEIFISGPTDVFGAHYGDKVIVTNLHDGSDNDLFLAKDDLHIGEVYTVDKINIYNGCSYIKLVEFPYVEYNVVYFDKVPQ